MGGRCSVPILRSVRGLEAAGAHVARALQLAPASLAILQRRRPLQRQRLAVGLQGTCAMHPASTDGPRGSMLPNSSHTWLQ